MDKKLLVWVAIALGALCASGTGAQTTYPERGIRVIVGLPPGSQPDTVARLLGPALVDAWSKSIIIDNVSGAAGNIATERVAKAAPDGYTLGLLTQGQIVVNPSLYGLTFDTVKDLAPVSLVSTSPAVLVVHNAVPATSLRDLIKLAKAAPGDLTFASGGSGSSPHIAAELLKRSVGIDMRHIPYKGIAAATPDVLAGRVTMMFAPASLALPLVRDRKLRALAVTSLHRFAAAPEVPTVAEAAVPSFQFTTWNGLFAPARTPAEIIRTVRVATAKALASSRVQARFTELGLEAIAQPSDEFGALIKSEHSRWEKLIRDAAIRVD